MCCLLKDPASTLSRLYFPCLLSHDACMQEDMYSFVSIADDQTTKGKGTVVVNDA